MREPENILIVRFSSLGDIILASQLIRLLRSRFPSAQLDILVKSEYADVVRFNPHLSSIIELQSSTFDELKTLGKRIRAKRYDLLIDIHNSVRSRYLRFNIGARVCRVVNKRAIQRFLLVQFKLNIYRETISVADRYIETTRDWGIHNDGMGLEVFLPDQITSSVTVMLSKYQLDRVDVVIGFAPSARHFTKRWPTERYIELAEKFAMHRRVKILIFGSRDETEYCGDIAQMINARIGSSTAESLAGKISLLETAAAMDHCQLVVSNDSGMMHLAAARKRNVVAVFGSTVKELGFFPYGTPFQVVETQGLDCRPCSHVGLAECPKGHFRCMRDIYAKDVFDAAQQFLSDR